MQLTEGRNCWRVAESRRLAVILDGEAYFAAVRRALIGAERRVLIVAWDIHSQVRLVREDPGDGLPTGLADLVLTLLERKRELEVYILLWSYAPIYALEREPLFFGDTPWDKHPRLHFVKDDTHPHAASHHQKAVVVDGRIAFCGGSSNLSNRSMGLDTECDLCVAAGDEGERAAIGGLRRRLLGMFLGVDAPTVAEAEEREGGLIAAIESPRSDGRTLAPLSGEPDPEWERQLPDDRLIDPDRPLNASDLSDAVVGKRSLPHARRRVWLGTALVLAMLGLAAALALVFIVGLTLLARRLFSQLSGRRPED